MQRAELDRLIAGRQAGRGQEIGTCCHDLRQGVNSWSPEMYRILGLPVGDGHPPPGFGMALYSRESQVRLKAAMAEALKRDGGRVDIDLSISHSGGFRINVHVVGVVTFEGGVPAWLDATMTERVIQRAQGGGLDR